MTLPVSKDDVRSAVPAPSESVLAVVPVLNESSTIARLIAQLLHNSGAHDMLVAVADGGSTDGTREIVAAIAAREPRVKLVDNTARLQSAGVNLAVRGYGEGRRWLVRVDAHAEYPDDYVQRLIGEAYRMGAASVVVAMTSHGERGFQRAAAIVQNSVLGAGGSPHRRGGEAGFVDHGHHALFDMQRFVAVGGYDETVSHNEDAEFDIRLARAGGRIWLTRAVAVTYFPRDNAEALFRQYLNYGRGRAATILRHRLRPKLRQMLPACVAPSLVAIYFSPWIPLASVPALVWATLSILFGAVLGLRKGGLSAAGVGLTAMLIHAAWSAGFWSEIARALRPKLSRRSFAQGSLQRP